MTLKAMALTGRAAGRAARTAGLAARARRVASDCILRVGEGGDCKVFRATGGIHSFGVSGFGLGVKSHRNAPNGEEWIQATNLPRTQLGTAPFLDMR